MLREIRFAGPLADRFGHDPITFDCDGVRSLFGGLESQFPGFRAELRRHHELVILKKTGDEMSAVSEDELQLSFGQADTIIVAAGTQGSAAEAAAWAFAAVVEYGAAAQMAAAAIAYVAVTMAIAFAAGAVMNALSDSPKGEKGEREKHASSLFNGAQNIYEQGGAIPLIYGRHRVGGTVISTEITTERLTPVSSASSGGPGGGSGGGSGGGGSGGGEGSVSNLNINVFYGSGVTLFNVFGSSQSIYTVTGWVINGRSRAVGQRYIHPDDHYEVSLAANGDVEFALAVSWDEDVYISYTAVDQNSNEYAANVNIYVRQETGGA
jgi:predicted phage tail protein